MFLKARPHSAPQVPRLEWFATTQPSLSTKFIAVQIGSTWLKHHIRILLNILLLLEVVVVAVAVTPHGTALAVVALEA